MSLTYEEQLEIVNETFRTILLIHEMVIRKKLRKQLEANNTNTFRSDSSNSGSRELALPIPRNPYSPCNELSKVNIYCTSFKSILTGNYRKRLNN